MAGPKPMRTEFGIHPRLESCVVSAEHCVDSVAIPSGETARERRGPV